MFTTHLTSMEKGELNQPTIQQYNRITPPKTNECSLKRDYFNREYIFQPLIFKPRLRSILFDTGNQESDGIWGRKIWRHQHSLLENKSQPQLVMNLQWVSWCELYHIFRHSWSCWEEVNVMVILFVLYLWMFTARMFLLFFVSFSVAKSSHSLYVSKRCWSAKKVKTTSILHSSHNLRILGTKKKHIIFLPYLPTRKKKQPTHQSLWNLPTSPPFATRWLQGTSNFSKVITKARASRSPAP